VVRAVQNWGYVAGYLQQRGGWKKGDLRGAASRPKDEVFCQNEKKKEEENYLGTLGVSKIN
jgi:hypothetical protein